MDVNANEKNIEILEEIFTHEHKIDETSHLIIKGTPGKGKAIFLEYLVHHYSINIANGCYTDFANTLQHKDRFVVNHEFIQTLKENISIIVDKLPKDRVLFRARILPREAITGFEKFLKEEKKNDIEFFGGCVPKYKDSEFVYRGYGAAHSLAPPPNKATAGRANFEGIPVLYMANHEETAVIETRAKVNDIVSVLTAFTAKPLRIVNFGKKIKHDITLFNGIKTLLDDDFSSPPNHNMKTEYLLTQTVAHHIKSWGYDGIAYKSAIDKKGLNYAFFNDAVIPYNTHLIKAKNYKINIEEVSDEMLEKLAKQLTDKTFKNFKDYSTK